MSLVPGAAVFLDRDGVLNVPEFRDGRSFAPSRLEDFRLYPDAVESTRRLKKAGYALVVVTNQPDVANNKISSAVVEAMHARMMEALSIDDVAVCYHTRADGCACRKPKPGLLVGAAKSLGLNLAHSFMVGDRAADIAAGEAVGCATIFIDHGYTAEAPPPRPDFVTDSLAHAADHILHLP